MATNDLPNEDQNQKRRNPPSDEELSVIQNQIEQIRHLENRGDRILRIVIAALGITIPVLLYLGREASITYTDLQSWSGILGDNTEILISNIASETFLPESASIIVVLFLAVGGILTIFASSFYLIFIGGTHTWNVIQPSNPSMRPDRINKEEASYGDVISSNSQLIGSKQNSLDETLKIISFSISLILGSVILVLGPFIIVQPHLALSGLLFLITITGIVLYEKLTIDRFFAIVKPRPIADLGPLFFGLIVVLDTRIPSGDLITTLLLIAIVLSFLVSVRQLMYMPFDDMGTYSLRNIASFLSIPLIFISTLILSDSSNSSVLPLFAGALGVLFVAASISIVITAPIFAAKYTVDSLPDSWREKAANAKEIVRKRASMIRKDIKSD